MLLQRQPHALPLNRLQYAAHTTLVDVQALKGHRRALQDLPAEASTGVSDLPLVAFMTARRPTCS